MSWFGSSTRKTTIFYVVLIAMASLVVGMVIASRLDLVADVLGADAWRFRRPTALRSAARSTPRHSVTSRRRNRRWSSASAPSRGSGRRISASSSAVTICSSGSSGAGRPGAARADAAGAAPATAALDAGRGLGLHHQQGRLHHHQQPRRRRRDENLRAVLRGRR